MKLVLPFVTPMISLPTDGAPVATFLTSIVKATLVATSCLKTLPRVSKKNVIVGSEVQGSAFYEHFKAGLVSIMVKWNLIKSVSLDLSRFNRH